MDEETFRQLFPITPNKELAQQMGVSVATVIHRARDLGLEKSPEYLHNLRHGIGAMSIPAMRERGTIPTREDHYNWKGGKPWQRFADPRYIEWRTAVLERDNYVCQHCHRQCKKYEKGLAAHHLQSYTYVPELRYEVSNGQTLCRECHYKVHGKQYTVEMVECACGCGTMIEAKDRSRGRRPRHYVNHHAKRQPTPKDTTMIPCECGCGTLISRIGARGTPIRFAPGHGTRKRWGSEEWQGEKREAFGKKVSEQRKHDTYKRQRNDKGQFA